MSYDDNLMGSGLALQKASNSKLYVADALDFIDGAIDGFQMTDHIGADVQTFFSRPKSKTIYIRLLALQSLCQYLKKEDFAGDQGHFGSETKGTTAQGIDKRAFATLLIK